MLRRERHEGHAVRRIGTRRVDGDLLAERGHVDVEFQALGAPDPILLHRLDALGPALELVEIGEKFVRIVRDLQEPL